jgi:hypothetical protein
MQSTATTALDVVIAVLLALLIALVGYVAVSNNSQASSLRTVIEGIERRDQAQDLAIQAVQIWQNNHDGRHGDFSPTQRMRRTGPIAPGAPT